MGTLIASAIVYGVLRDVFHGAHIVNGLYSVEVSILMLLNAPLPFPSHKDDPLQLLLN
jgi:hypothetical protein